MAFNLRAILMLIVLISTAPMFVVIVQTSISEQNHAMETATASLRNQARLRASAQEQLFEGAHHMLRTIDHDVPMQLDAVETCSGYLRRIGEHFPRYMNIAFADPAGNLVCRSTTAAGPTYVGDRQYFQAAVRTGQFTVGEYLLGRLLNKPALVFSLPVYRPTGQLHGVLYVALSLDGFQDEFKEIPVPRDMTELITDSQGVLVKRCSAHRSSFRAQTDRSLYICPAAFSDSQVFQPESGWPTHQAKWHGLSAQRAKQYDDFGILAGATCTMTAGTSRSSFWVQPVGDGERYKAVASPPRSLNFGGPVARVIERAFERTG
jgi:hypothetical protein